MANKTKSAVSGNKRLYIGISLFSLLWLIFSVPFEATKRLDYSWGHFVLNLPSMLNTVAKVVSDQNDPEDPFGNSYSFGKYITKPAHPKVSIIAIDELSLEEYGWPVPRSYYGNLVEQLEKYGVKGIFFDIIVSKSKRDKDSDNRRFVEAVAKAGNVGNLVFRDPNTKRIIYPVKGLAKASAIMGQPHVEALMDSDGQVRRYMPFWGGPVYQFPLIFSDVKFITYGETELKDTLIGKEFPGLPVPSIGIGAYSFYSGKHLSQLFLEYSDGKILNYRNFVARKKHPAWDTDKDRETLSSFRHISFADILSGRLTEEEKEALKGGIALVGATAMGAYDHCPSPFAQQLPGVEVHATFLDNVISGDFRETISYAWISLLILILPWLPVILRRYSLAILVVVCSSVLLGLSMVYVLLLANCLMMPFPSIALALFLPFAYITVDKGLMEGREKKWIKNTFGQYLSPKVVELITKDPARLSLGGEKREMTAFFLDIAGFTTMSEKMTPEELTSMLNEYLSGLTDIILKHDGVVDKYIGDCIMAFWNAPLDQKDHRRLACLAAVDCQAEMARLNEKLTQYAIKPSCRVGLNSGPMVVGNMGSKTRLSYTVMGDSVNLASRLEGANKFFHSQIMASGETFDESKDLFDHRFLGSIRVVGKAIPVKVYEPFARKGAAGPEVTAMLKSYGAGTEKFYAGKYAQAAKDFKAALKARPSDGPSQFYLELAEKYEKEAPKDWDGSFNLTSK
ncbi:MAG TPA: hypothetical protein DCS63_09735 [Elusimicrobia bacterium]|nr:hypothetical protein [Elusimicrobiota bacterium]